MPKAPYNVLTDFAPINLVGDTPLILAVRPGLGVNTVKDLLQLSQKQKITLASAGAGGLTHLVIESLNLASKNNIIHVPYKGGGPALADAVAGHVDGLVADFPPLVPMFKEKRLVAVAVTSPKRTEFLPEVATVGEDIPGFVAMSWYGLMAPAKTPRNVIDKVNAAIAKVMARDDVRAQLKTASVSPRTLASPEAFQKFVAADYARWGKLIRETHIVTTE
ncbi:tripartite-type tricarboxylate transporter receptor subunit TctC [Variovorax sp. Sphag1AA]|nr:tripartite-type tricarboxylate transporter receptor subunit TctC [Variovorax sp. Sphag1AA]